MEFEFELTKDEMVAFGKVVDRRIARMAKGAIGNVRLGVLNAVSAVPLGVAGAAFLFLYQDYPYISSDLNTIVIAAALAAVLMTGSSIYKRKVIEKAVYAHDGWLGTQSVTADEAGIAVTSPDSTTQLSWTRIRDVVEDDAMFYLFLDLTHALVYPKRAFRSSAEIDQFRRWATTRSGN